MTVLHRYFFYPYRDDPDAQSARVVEAMKKPKSYPAPTEDVKHYETHISHVFIPGEFAYKVKKPIKTEFLDYSTLEKRHRACIEEVRLDRRFVDDLYVGVVPISIDDGDVAVEGSGAPVEYAVKMHRFSDDSLLSHRLQHGLVTKEDVHELAVTIACFHAGAQPCAKEIARGVPERMHSNLIQIIQKVDDNVPDSVSSTLQELRDWSNGYASTYSQAFSDRSANGFIRECHGDLHLENIIYWKGKLAPFDGIEFNDDFRWIDVINDAAFLAMDLAAQGRMDLSRIFISSYLEATGDYESLAVLRWYLAYRAMVRALVAKMKADQHSDDPDTVGAMTKDFHEHVALAHQYTMVELPTLYITHGLSGSGKSYASEKLVARDGAIRLRSDVERKRLFATPNASNLSDQSEAPDIYAEASNIATYNRLLDVAHIILRQSASVVIDAAFLRRADRDRLHQMAIDEGVRFAILDCRADLDTLRERIQSRRANGKDPSDADLHVLEQQIQLQEPLTDAETALCVDVPE